MAFDGSASGGSRSPDTGGEADFMRRIRDEAVVSLGGAFSPNPNATARIWKAGAVRASAAQEQGRERHSCDRQAHHGRGDPAQ